MSTGYPDFWFRAWMIVAMYFLTLKDTPGSYVGQANKVPAVNAGESGLEFINPYSGYGLAANIGAPGIKGRFYFATDTGVLYEDDGTAWIEITRKEASIRLAQLSEKAHASLTGVTADQHHAETHAHVSHTAIGANDHHAQAHTLASHSTKAHAELASVTKDQHHNEDHATRHEDDGDDPVTPLIHHLRHETGGADEVAGLVFPLVMLNPAVNLLATSEPADAYTDVNISAYTGDNVAKAAILCVETYLWVDYSGNYGKHADAQAFFRKKGGNAGLQPVRSYVRTANVTADYPEGNRAINSMIVEVDANQIFQYAVLNEGTHSWDVINFFINLVGYFK